MAGASLSLGGPTGRLLYKPTDNPGGAKKRNLSGYPFGGNFVAAAGTAAIRPVRGTAG